MPVADRIRFRHVAAAVSIAATLRLFDAIAAREHIVKWFVITAVAGVVCLVAHPRIAFTYALILVPFIVLRLPWKLILGAFIAMCVGAVAFVALMLTSFNRIVGRIPLPGSIAISRPRICGSRFRSASRMALTVFLRFCSHYC